MAKKAQAEREEGGESVQGYFRRIFEENPQLLEGRSNEELLRRWLADHPGYDEPPPNIKNGMQNIKSVLRRQAREENALSPTARSMVEAPGGRLRSASRYLQVLEEQIDECLLLARSQDPEGLQSVIKLLRRARNEVVWKIGE
ncbi:MAG TPA: hypothetical protein VEL76_08125 [Gemmataceae bacterium]|nr:hypothetical protein [Gemmataceae bacterium]